MVKAIILPHNVIAFTPPPEKCIYSDGKTKEFR